MSTDEHVIVSPVAVTRRLVNLEADLDASVKELERLGIEAAKAAGTAERTYAEKYLATEGPEHVRRQQATLAAESERYAERVAAHLVVTQREAIRKLHASIEVARTMSANVRSEIELGKTGVRP